MICDKGGSKAIATNMNPSVLNPRASATGPMLDDRAMPVRQDSASLRVIEHPDFGSYLRAVEACDFLFVPDSPEEAISRLAAGPGLAQLHRLGTHRACIGLSSLCPDDLPALRSICRSVLVRRIGSRTSRQFPDITPMQKLEALGFRLFFEHGSDGRWLSGLKQHRRISLVEFAISTSARLAEYPAVTHGAVTSMIGKGTVRKVVVLDLVQDFEILRPILLQCAASAEWRDTRVSVSELVTKSHTWEAVRRFLVALGIPWFNPLGPVDTVNALGSGKAMLLTASESTAPNHKFSHEVCRTASPRTTRITIQHGYECVGLRHHRGHNRAFPKGVRFASDYILTWAGPESLPNLHPSDREKCVPVGVVKAFAEETASPHHDPIDVGAAAQAIDVAACEPFPVLIAENLHSTRFIDPARYQRFRDFILDVNDGGFAVTVRSHPARRTLEKGKTNDALTFLTGELRVSDLRRFGMVVSPPSTIVLDAVLAGVPVALWSEQVDFGDCENYPGIPSVCDLGDFAELCKDRKAMEDMSEANYRWAAQNVCAFNGVPQAWSRLNELAG